MRLIVLLGVLTALAAAGASGAQSGPFPGTKTAKDRTAWRAILHWPASCEEGWKPAPGAGIVVWRTSTGRRLVQVTCSLAAYQGTFMLYLVDASRDVTGPLGLLAYRDPGSGRPTVTRETQILGLASFAPGTGRLTILDKFRGIGDCGIYSTFRLAGDRFVPVEVRAKTRCDGRYGGGPTRWPRLPLPHAP